MSKKMDFNASITLLDFQLSLDLDIFKSELRNFQSSLNLELF